jgi:hypothetical protein
VAEIAHAETIDHVDVVDRDGVHLGTARPDHAQVEKSRPAARAARASRLGVSTSGLAVSPFGAPSWWSPTAENTATIGIAVEADPFRGGPADVRGRVAASGSIGRLGLEGAFATDAARGKIASDGGAWLGARYRAIGGARGDLELGPALRVGFPVSTAKRDAGTMAGGVPARLEVALGLGSEKGAWSWLLDVGSRIDLDRRPAGAFSMPAFGVGGVTYDVVPWLRAHAALDAELVFDSERAPCVRCRDDAAHPAGGLTMGLEAGTTFFATLSGRVSPFADPWGGVSGALALGLRSPP